MVHHFLRSRGALRAVVSHGSAYSRRDCYADIREFSIYVHREAKRRGIACKLLIALIHAARKASCSINIGASVQDQRPTCQKLPNPNIC